MEYQKSYKYDAYDISKRPALSKSSVQQKHEIIRLNCKSTFEIEEIKKPVIQSLFTRKSFSRRNSERRLFERRISRRNIPDRRTEDRRSTERRKADRRIINNIFGYTVDRRKTDRRALADFV